MPEVDRSFMRELKNLDSRLGCKFEGEHNHFVITYQRAYGEPVNLHLVEADNGGFRQPDKRDLEVLWQGDRARGDKPEIKLKKAAYEAELSERKRRSNFSQELRDMTKDSKNQLQKAFVQATNLGKGNSAFRRITPKPSKNVVRSIP